MYKKLKGTGPGKGKGVVKPECKVKDVRYLKTVNHKYNPYR
jgi:hypothetical protein